MKSSRKYLSAGGGHTATVNFLNSKAKQTRAGLKDVLGYCMIEDKTLSDGQQLVTGVNCVAQSAYTEMMNTKTQFRKTDSKMYYHLVQSFSPDEKITPETAHRLAVEFAQQQFSDYEVLVATHTDADHIHSHFVLNSVSCETGYKYHSDKNNINRLRNASDELCLKYGLSVIGQKKETESAEKMSPREYRSAERGESWKMMLIVTIEDCMKRAYSKEDFIRLMRSQGYDVKWTDERKNITYTTPTGMKCRDNKLHEEKFLKGNMEYEFRLRKEITAGIEEHSPSADGEKRSHFGSAEFTAEYDYKGRNGVHAEQSDHSAEFSDGTVPKYVGANSKADGAAHGESYKDSGTNGWEYEREFFKRALYGKGSYAELHHSDAFSFPDTVSGGHYIGRDIASLTADMMSISDASDDPEEQRKRIEAEQNGEAIGLFIGTAAGLLGALTDDDSSDEDFEEEYDDTNVQSL